MLDIIVNPFISILLFLYDILGGNVVLAIVVFTVLVRLATYPLTLKQQRSSKAMQDLQPELKKIQEKYKNDRERAAQAQWELYREYGVNPLASCLPLLIQFPILIGLYRAIIATLAATPLQLLDLSGRLWLPELSRLVPLQNRFLWLNLATPDPLYLLPILVVVTTWLQQKIMMPSTPSTSGGDKSSDQAAAMTRQMTTIMPLMFGIFALSFASGLSIYFIVSNVIGIAQYSMMGKVDLKRLIGRGGETEDAVSAKSKRKATVVEEEPAQVEAAAQPTQSEKPKREKKKRESSRQPVIKPKRSGISDTRANAKKAKG